MKEIQKLKKSDIAFSRAKEIINADKESSEPMSKEDKDELYSITEKLVDYAVITLMGGSSTNIFWAHVLLIVKRKIDYSLPAAAAVGIKNSGPTLFVNPYQINRMCDSFDGFIDVINHEGYHLLYNHLIIYKEFLDNERLRDAMNIGTDCEINQHLPNIPEGTISLEYVKELCGNPDIEPFKGSLYYIKYILEAIDKSDSEGQSDGPLGSGGGSGSGGDGQGDGEGNGSTNSEKESQDGIKRDGSSNRHSSWRISEDVSDSYGKEMVKDLFNTARDLYRNSPSGKGRGDLPSDIENNLEKLNEPAKLPWTTLFRRAIAFSPKGKKLTKNRFNRRQPNRLEKKGKINGDGKRVYLFLDTSGSMSEEELKDAFIEMTSIAKQSKMDLYFAQVDTVIQSTTKVENVSDLKWSTSGGGGTCMQAGFDYLNSIQADRRSQVVFFTDGYIENTIEDYGFEHVLWVLTDGDGSQLDPSIKGVRAQLDTREIKLDK